MMEKKKSNPLPDGMQRRKEANAIVVYTHSGDRSCHLTRTSTIAHSRRTTTSLDSPLRRFCVTRDLRDTITRPDGLIECARTSRARVRGLRAGRATTTASLGRRTARVRRALIVVVVDRDLANRVVGRHVRIHIDAHHALWERNVTGRGDGGLGAPAGASGAGAVGGKRSHGALGDRRDTCGAVAAGLGLGPAGRGVAGFRWLRGRCGVHAAFVVVHVAADGGGSSAPIVVLPHRGGVFKGPQRDVLIVVVVVEDTPAV